MGVLPKLATSMARPLRAYALRWLGVAMTDNDTMQGPWVTDEQTAEAARRSSDRQAALAGDAAMTDNDGTTFVFNVAEAVRRIRSPRYVFQPATFTWPANQVTSVLWLHQCGCVMFGDSPNHPPRGVNCDGCDEVGGRYMLLYMQMDRGEQMWESTAPQS